MSADSLAPCARARPPLRATSSPSVGCSAAEGDRCRNRGMPQQNLIHFVRRDILTAADDDVFDPSRQMQIAVGVEKALVAGAKPSIHKSASVGFGIVFVSAKHIRSLNGNFAALVGAEMVAVFVHDADAQAGAHADRARFAMPRRQEDSKSSGGQLRSFRRLRRKARQKSFDFVNEFRRQGRAAGTDEAQRGGLCGFVMSPRQQKLMHRGHARIPGHAMFPHRPPERKRIEFGGNNHRSAGKQSRHGRADQSVNMKQRHDAQRNIFLGKRVSVRDIGRGDGEVEMPQGHALGTPRASAGVQDQSDIVSRWLRCRSSAGSTCKSDLPLLVHLAPRTLGSCGPRLRCARIPRPPADRAEFWRRCRPGKKGTPHRDRPGSRGPRFRRSRRPESSQSQAVRSATRCPPRRRGGCRPKPKRSPGRKPVPAANRR